MMVSLRSGSDEAEEIILKMTGTDAESAQRLAQQLGRESGRKGAWPCEASVGSEGVEGREVDKPNHHDRQQVTRLDAAACDEIRERRAWDSNPQPVARHLNSNQDASHSLTLQKWRELLMIEHFRARAIRDSGCSGSAGGVVASNGGERAFHPCRHVFDAEGKPLCAIMQAASVAAVVASLPDARALSMPNGQSTPP